MHRGGVAQPEQEARHPTVSPMLKLSDAEQALYCCLHCCLYCCLYLHGLEQRVPPRAAVDARRAPRPPKQRKRGVPARLALPRCQQARCRHHGKQKQIARRTKRDVHVSVSVWWSGGGRTFELQRAAVPRRFAAAAAAAAAAAILTRRRGHVAVLEPPLHCTAARVHSLH